VESIPRLLTSLKIRAQGSVYRGEELVWQGGMLGEGEVDAPCWSLTLDLAIVGLSAILLRFPFIQCLVILQIHTGLVRSTLCEESCKKIEVKYTTL